MAAGRPMGRDPSRRPRARHRHMGGTERRGPALSRRIPAEPVRRQGTLGLRRHSSDGARLLGAEYDQSLAPCNNHRARAVGGTVVRCGLVHHHAGRDVRHGHAGGIAVDRGRYRDRDRADWSKEPVRRAVRAAKQRSESLRSGILPDFLSQAIGVGCRSSPIELKILRCTII